MAEDWPEALIVATWPEPREPEGWEESKIADFALVQEIVRSIRNLRAEKNVAPSKRIAATIAAGAKTGSGPGAVPCACLSWPVSTKQN